MQLSCREVRRGTAARGATVPVRHGGSSPRQPPKKIPPNNQGEDVGRERTHLGSGWISGACRTAGALQKIERAFAGIMATIEDRITSHR
jgi:hypothetical protein